MKQPHARIILAGLALIVVAPASARGLVMELSDQERSRCVEALMQGLADDSPLVRVHAAEALVSLNRPEPALTVFRPKRETTEPVDRVVSWRVLAAAEPEAESRREYIERIRTILLDPDATDRTHAMESLAKLKIPAATEGERRCIQEVADSAGPASPFALWRLAQSGNKDAVDRLAKLLASHESVTRFRAIYVLGRLQAEYPAALVALSAAMATEPDDSSERSILRAAVGGEPRRELLDDPKVSPSDRYFATVFLADFGSPSDYPRLARVLSQSNGDLRIGSAYAMLKIDSRSPATD